MSDLTEKIAVLTTNPKVTGPAGAIISATGFAGYTEMIHGWLSIMTMVIGLAVGVLTFCIQYIKFRQIHKEYNKSIDD